MIEPIDAFVQSNLLSVVVAFNSASDAPYCTLWPWQGQSIGSGRGNSRRYQLDASLDVVRRAHI
jgi:hypothetical protein